MRGLDRLFLPPDLQDVLQIIAEGGSINASGVPSQEMTPERQGDNQITPNRNEAPIHGADMINQTPNQNSDSLSFLDIDDSFFERLFNLGPLGEGGLTGQDSIYNTMSNVIFIHQRIDEINRIREVGNQFSSIANQLETLQRQMTTTANHLLLENNPTQAMHDDINSVIDNLSDR